MTGRINLTASMRSNLLSLQNISRQVSSTQNKLATGNKVNSAIDNPSSYYTARALNNRADDLNALLDSMGQAVSTIKAATTALETGADLLEQAAAVATQALEQTNVPSKSWFEQQENVAAVVSTKEELLEALNTVTGNIVIYGQINMGTQNIELKAGQNLVGIGYFTNINANIADREINKFSALSFNLGASLHDSAIEAVEGNNLLSGLSINIDMGQRYNVSGLQVKDVALKDVRLNIVNNSAHYDTDTMSFGIKLIADGNLDISGINNFSQSGDPGRFSMLRTLGGSVINAQDATINIKTENWRAWGTYGATLELHGHSRLNILSGSLGCEMTTIKMYDNAEINSLMQLYSSTITMNDARNVIRVNKPYFDHDIDPQWSSTLTMVEGASIITGSGSFTAPAGGINNQRLTDNYDLTKAGLKKTSETTAAETEEYKKAFAEFMADKTDLSTELAWNNADEITQYNQILQQYDHLISDGGYKGTNLLQQDNLTVLFSPNRGSSLKIGGIDASAEGLGLSQTEQGGSLEKSIEQIRHAVLQIRSYSAELGNNYNIITGRQDFTENLINILTEGADKLTLADMNEESANMLALQTRQQLAVNSLSLASQASQAVLKLF